MQPTPSQVRAQIFVAVASALTSKWPVQGKKDYESIAKTTRSLTEELLNEYWKIDSEQVEE